MKIRPLFKWYDLWIGAFWDRSNRRLYILPLPCVGIVVQFAQKKMTLDEAEVVMGWIESAQKFKVMSDQELVQACMNTNAGDYDVVTEMANRIDPEWSAENRTGVEGQYPRRKIEVEAAQYCIDIIHGETAKDSKRYGPAYFHGRAIKAIESHFAISDTPAMERDATDEAIALAAKEGE